jgi:hypothetical protein
MRSSNEFQTGSARLAAARVDFDFVFEPVALLDFFQTGAAYGSSKPSNFSRAARSTFRFCCLLTRLSSGLTAS